MTLKTPENTMAENYFGLTDTGRVRGNNEDTFVAQPTANNRLILAGVIDGVGGYNGGEVAAAIAREEVLNQLGNAQEDFIPAMITALRQASKKIYQRRQQEKELDSMACVTTLAIADVSNNQFYYAHVGDTRLYLLRDGSLVKISKDHSFVGFLEDSGRLTESAAMSHPKRNEINKALGFDTLIETDDEYIETGQSPFLPGDVLLLCSDGLTDMVDKDTMTGILTQNTSLESKATQLIAAANNNGGHDNITVVLVQNNKVSQRQDATMPAPVSKKREEVADSNAAAKPVTANQSPVSEPAQVTAPRSNTSTIILSILCLIFLASTIWLYLRGRQQEPSQPITPNAVAGTTASERNADELKLQDAIDKATGSTLVLADSVFKQPVIISDTLKISKDTLFIKGNIIIKRDSSYQGPALIIAATCKSTGLEGLKFEGFDTAIQAANTPVSLKNVQFINCTYGIRKVLPFITNKMITVDLPVMHYRADTIAASTSKLNGTR
jgi:serine/threonine protein phosphatase PrpC